MDSPCKWLTPTQKICKEAQPQRLPSGGAGIQDPVNVLLPEHIGNPGGSDA